MEKFCGWKRVRMATAGEMVARTAEVFGLNVSTLESIDRTLVVAGLRHKGGRGRSGAQMTARDIAHLAIAAAHDVAMKDAAALVGKVSALPRGPCRFRNLPGSDDVLDLLSEGSDWSIFPNIKDLEERLPGAQALLAEPDLSAAMSRVIDALAEVESGEIDLQVSIRFSNQGPKATILYQVGQAQLEVFYMPSKTAWTDQRVDRSFGLSTMLLHDLANIIHGDRASIAARD